MELAELIERLRTVFIKFIIAREKLLRQDAHEDAITVELIGYLKKYFADWPYQINHNYDK